VERFIYAEAFRCDSCEKRVRIATFNLKRLRYVKCPSCHSVDLTILKRPDRIDRMQKGLLNALQRVGGGKLYHCWFCRIQFYDTRPRCEMARKPGKDFLPPPTDPDSKVELAS
jgi:DNA-directed RNA polymerase subunit RPC12/RpoP